MKLISEDEEFYICVVVAVKILGIGKIITAYETEVIKNGKILFQREA